MRLEDVIGPVMIGPSSSHTAGAARLGRLAALIWGRPVREVTIFLRGSFAATWWGHGTDLAILAGLLGFLPDDPRIPNAREEAKKKGIHWTFKEEHPDGAHPNSARFLFKDEDTSMEVVGASIGGGAVRLLEIDGFKLELSGELPALVTFHRDTPGVVASITGLLASKGLNIATLTLHRQGRGKGAAMVVELDENPQTEIMDAISRCHSEIFRVLPLKLGE
ncbi:L-serine dehydratase, iron-sulfur-dependent, beta subunit [Thermovirga lienii DSM 17291]|jgi:L-serine dehydratase|uniref:L-serine dehydratase n=1 Tax=Thermovirga lienii (strain ATCC BAA-1197 / DSM 17291 / Cas60314) TaxID=580340 RepID=G7V5H9_THELD|nr:L-serine ammonia-lyase, iron-sulfur-dependent subunit beta [Thermovirga lienii]AER65806.1 L-serine dehydratase, iron-sulfur-dependent, beta subunit [Thermovirga lienii DSM 17291]